MLHRIVVPHVKTLHGAVRVMSKALNLRSPPKRERQPRDPRMTRSPAAGKCSDLDGEDIFHNIREHSERDDIKAERFVHLPKYKPKTMPAPRKAPMVCARM